MSNNSSQQQQQQGQYPPPPQAYGAHPPSQPYRNSSTPTQGDMINLPLPPYHQQPDFYRHHPPPYDMYQGHPQDPHRGPPPPPPQHMAYNQQPAPRQRTAIACRYCRRRKIRCSGFEASEDGRCTNCSRFQQDCIFTPVSSQAQAFVPAHTAYPHLRNPGIPPQRGGRPIYPQQGQPVIYGAHGQPLGPMGHDPNYPPPPHGYPMPQYQGMPVYDDRGLHPPPHVQEQVSRKRPRRDEPSHPALSPKSQEPSSSHPYVEQQGRAPQSSRRGSAGGSGYEYPDPSQLVPASPSTSVTSYQSAPYPQPPQPYYPPQPSSARRSSPQSAYSVDARASGSPPGSVSSASGYIGLHPPQVPPPREGRTPPPSAGREGSNGGSGSRAGMSVREMLGPGDSSGGRTSTDSDMLNALNRRGM